MKAAANQAKAKHFGTAQARASNGQQMAEKAQAAYYNNSNVITAQNNPANNHTSAAVSSTKTPVGHSSNPS